MRGQSFVWRKRRIACKIQASKRQDKINANFRRQYNIYLQHARVNIVERANMRGKAFYAICYMNEQRANTYKLRLAKVRLLASGYVFIIIIDAIRHQKWLGCV